MVVLLSVYGINFYEHTYNSKIHLYKGILQINVLPECIKQKNNNVHQMWQNTTKSQRLGLAGYCSFKYGSLYVTLCFVLCPFDFRVFVC